MSSVVGAALPTYEFLVAADAETMENAANARRPKPWKTQTRSNSSIK